MPLVNPGFEDPWVEGSHTVRVFRPGQEPEDVEIGNCFSPPGWLPFMYHDPERGWDQPEMGEIHADSFPDRVHEDAKAFRIFTFCRRHSAGLMQAGVAVPRGSLLTFGAWFHAWSNNYGPYVDDPEYSEGVEYGQPGFWLEGQAPNDAAGNFLAYMGIDPHGGTDVLSDSVIWGPGAHIYNVYAPVPPVSVIAESDVVTVFLNSKVMLFPFKHCDGYWDGAWMEILEPPQMGYPKTSVLVNQNMRWNWIHRALGGIWNDPRFTLTASADDAGGRGYAGPPTVIALNPHAWPGGSDALEAYYEAYYPGTKYIPVTGTRDTIGAKVEAILSGEDPGEPPVEPPPPTDDKVRVGLHLQGGAEGIWDYYDATQSTVLKAFWLEALNDMVSHSPETAFVFRHWVGHQGPYLQAEDKPAAARAFIDLFRDSLTNLAVQSPIPIGVESLNEEYACFSDNNQNSIDFDIAFCEALAEIPNTYPVVFCAPVGNPHESEFEMLVPLARAVEEHGGALGYHCYWGANPNHSYLSTWWPWLAGRWTEMDKVFEAHGVHPRWLSGEGGGVGGYTYSELTPTQRAMVQLAMTIRGVTNRVVIGGKRIKAIVKHPPVVGSMALSPNQQSIVLLADSGWRDGDCYGGNWSRYLADIAEFQRRVHQWNDEHDNRFLGGVLFTTAGPGWESFEIRQEQMESLAQNL